MADLPAGLNVGNLYCFPIGSPGEGEFAYIPSAALDAQGGRANATLMSSSAGAIISIGAVWQAEQKDLDIAQSDLSKHYPQATDINLRYADLQDITASLTIQSNDGASHTVGPKPASGMEPNRVVFQDTLTSAEKEAVKSALDGQPNILLLTYTGNLALQEMAEISMEGDLVDAVRQLASNKQSVGIMGGFGKKKAPEPPPLPDLAQCAVAVQNAIDGGRLKLSRGDSLNVSENTKSRTESELRERVARMLRDKLAQLGSNAAHLSSFKISQSASETEDMTYQVSRTADLGAWISRTASKASITEAGAVIAEPAR